MYISRVVVRNFRNLSHIDVPLGAAVNCVIGENNGGKSNLLTAIRLCLDAGLPSTYRKLSASDICADVQQNRPFQVLVGVEFADYSGDLNQLALLHACQLSSDRARIFFRFRPRKIVREELASGERREDSLQADDYSWEICGGGDPSKDLASVHWHEDLGQPVNFADLQYFQVITLHALRDVEADLRNSRASPLVKLLEASSVSEDEKSSFVATISGANAEIAKSNTLGAAVGAIEKTLAATTGPSYNFGLQLGIGDPTYQSILRSFRVLLSEQGGISDVDPSRNGLGLNNVLYISIWLEYLQKRVSQDNAAGQLILIEEPEAHLHPQLQMTLMSALERLSFQTCVTTHSTHVTSRLPIDSNLILTRQGERIIAHSVATNAGLSSPEMRDLERYLDSTKSTLLFARRIILVEGAAELLLLPALIKELMEIDLEHQGISLVSINGTHFLPFLKLVSNSGIGKRCAVVADGDARASDLDDDGETAIEPRVDLRAYSSDSVGLFFGETTFERELAFPENARMLVAAAHDAGLTSASQKLEALSRSALLLTDGSPERIAQDELFRDATLRVAKRVGKGRFAQLCAQHVTGAYLIPEYISEAVDWLTRR